MVVHRDQRTLSSTTPQTPRAVPPPGGGPPTRADTPILELSTAGPVVPERWEDEWLRALMSACPRGDGRSMSGCHGGTGADPARTLPRLPEGRVLELSPSGSEPVNLGGSVNVLDR